MKNLILIGMMVLLLALVIACQEDENSSTWLNINSNLEMAGDRPAMSLGEYSDEIQLLLNPHVPYDEPNTIFLGWEIVSDIQIQQSVLTYPLADYDNRLLHLTGRYEGVGSLLARDYENLVEKIYFIHSGLDWELKYQLPVGRYVRKQLFYQAEDEIVFCEESSTGTCQLKMLDGSGVTDIALPTLANVGLPFKFLSDGRAAVYDFDNELIYYRAAREDPWTNIALPAAFTASSPWYVVFFEFQLVSDGFWALLNVYHEEYGDEHRSRFCHYVAGAGWNECLEVEGRRMDAAVALADDSLHLFGVKSTPLGYDDYYHTFIHWPVDDSGVGAATEVVFPRDLTPNENGYVQTEPKIFAGAEEGEGYVLVKYAAEDVIGTAPTSGKLLYRFADGEVTYMASVEALLDQYQNWGIYPVGMDRIYSSR